MSEGSSADKGEVETVENWKKSRPFVENSPRREKKLVLRNRKGNPYVSQGKKSGGVLSGENY